MASWSLIPERAIAPALLASLALFGTSAAWGGGCDTTCPGGAISVDTDPCNDELDALNGGCNNLGEEHQDVGTLTGVPTVVCGTVGGFVTAEPADSRDLDWYHFTLTTPATVTLSIIHEGPEAGSDIVLFLREGSACLDQVTLFAASSVECPFSISADLPSGEHTIIVTTNSFGIGVAGSACPVNYVATLTHEPISVACETATNPCETPSKVGGCEDLSCCALICASDSFCCDTTWDEICADSAINDPGCGIFLYACEKPGAANDCVGSATVVEAGDVVAFDTTTANTDGPDQPECGSAKGDEPIHHDVWYVIVAPGDGLLNSSVCGTTDFDTKIAAYGPYANAAAIDPTELPSDIIDCNEDSGTCAFFTSALQIDALAGQTYLFRLGGYKGASGIGTISFGFNTNIYFNGPPRDVIFNNNLTTLGQSNGNLSAGQPQRWTAEKIVLPALPEGDFTHWKINELQPQGFLAAAPTVTENAEWKIWTHISDTQAPTPADELYSGLSPGVDFLGDSLIVDLSKDDVLLEPGPYYVNVHGHNDDVPFQAANFAWFMNPEFGENLINPATSDAFTWRSAMYPTPGFLFDASPLIVQVEGLDPFDRYNHSIAILGSPVTVEEPCQVNPADGCSGDVTGKGNLADGQVNGQDLGQLLLDFGNNDGCPTGEGDTEFSTDIAGEGGPDGVVDGNDLGQLLLQFTGNPCP